MKKPRLRVAFSNDTHIIDFHFYKVKYIVENKISWLILIIYGYNLTFHSVQEIIYHMKRYAFIDVQNTASTTQQLLGFIVDWNKLCEFLKTKKLCDQVFLYTGIDNGDIDTAHEFDELSKVDHCNVRAKSIFSYKNKDKIISFKCDQCSKEGIQTVDMGYRKKANCDVDLSVDVIEKSGPDTEILLFTGDGDFEYLIRKALEKEVSRFYVYSHAEKIIKANITKSRFSIKLKNLITEKKDKVFYVSLKDIKDQIKKVI